MASQLLQILQQGIQAKERAQQADIDRGMRELQIGKEESLQRERLTFQKTQNIADRQFDLLKLSRQMAADEREQSSDQMHDLNLEALSNSNDWKVLEEQRRFQTEDKFQAELGTLLASSKDVELEILQGWASGYPSTAIAEDTRLELKGDIDKIFKKINPVIGSTLFNAYVSAGTGNLQPLQDVMDYLNDTIVMANKVYPKGDTIGLAAKVKAQNMKSAFAAMGYDVDGDFIKTFEAYTKNKEMQGNIQKESLELASRFKYDKKGNIIKETDEERRERRYSPQTDLNIVFPETDNEQLSDYMKRLEDMKLLAAKKQDDKDSGWLPESQEEAFKKWQDETEILGNKETALITKGNSAKTVFSGDVHDILEKTFLSLQKKNKVFRNSDWRGIIGDYVTEKETSDKKHVQLAMQHMKKSSINNFLGHNLMSSMEHDKLRKIFGMESFQQEFKKQSNMFLQKYPRNQYWYDNQIFGNIMPVGRGKNEVKAQTRALKSHADAMSFFKIMQEGLGLWDEYTEQLGIQRDAFSKTGM